MHEIPIKVQNHLSKKEYLHATKLLVEAASLGKDSLEGIEGIKELKVDIEQKKEVCFCKNCFYLVGQAMFFFAVR